MREKNYPDPDKKIIFPLDWIKFFGRKRNKLDKQEQFERFPPKE